MRYEHGQKFLYLIVLIATHGCIESALLWYKFYVKFLMDMCFMVNPYYIFVSNQTIIGNQCTIVWYINDNKISHVYKNIVTQVLSELKDNF